MKRRELLISVGSMLVSGCAPSPLPVAPKAASNPFDAIEKRIGGRVGVHALNTANGRELSHRADERFAMCSTFKWTLVAALLARVDRKEVELDQHVSYGEADLLDHAPTTRANVGAGYMTVDALAEAAITESDNTAANLLLTLVDGPKGVTTFLRRLGDEVTRLDRNEPALNTNVADDPRDTTAPRAMVGTLQRIVVGDVLSPPSRDHLVRWMKGCKTGLERLRAGFPADWSAGDKTGTGNNGAANDVAIVTPPGRSPILVASYLSGSTEPLATLNTAHASIGRIVAAWALS